MLIELNLPIDYKKYALRVGKKYLENKLFIYLFILIKNFKNILFHIKRLRVCV